MYLIKLGVLRYLQWPGDWAITTQERGQHTTHPISHEKHHSTLVESVEHGEPKPPVGVDFRAPALSVEATVSQ